MRLAASLTGCSSGTNASRTNASGTNASTFERLHARQRRAGGLCDRSLPCHKFEQVDCAGGQIARSPRPRATPSCLGHGARVAAAGLPLRDPTTPKALRPRGRPSFFGEFNLKTALGLKLAFWGFLQGLVSHTSLSRLAPHSLMRVLVRVVLVALVHVVSGGTTCSGSGMHDQPSAGTLAPHTSPTPPLMTSFVA